MFFNHNIETVIFDCDGVLADTMPLHCEAYYRAFKEFGLSFERELFYRSAAGKARDTIKKLLAGQNYEDDWCKLHQRKKEIVIELIDSELQPLASARLVPLLNRGYRLSVVSSGSAISVHRIVNHLGLSNYFEEIITGDDVKLGKPNPEPFLLAAKKMMVAPEKCLVIEHSEAGIQAAERAGMDSINVYSFIPKITS